MIKFTIKNLNFNKKKKASLRGEFLPKIDLFDVYERILMEYETYLISININSIGSLRKKEDEIN